MTSSGAAELVLAVDGGNSKTDVALLDARGGLLSAVRGGGSSPHELGIDGSVAAIEGLLEHAVGNAGLGAAGRPLAASAHILLAGADLPEERAELSSRFEQLDWSARLVVDTDMPALLRAGTDRGWGIAVGCGAGINCLGRAPDGREARFLSMGRTSGDWGGGPDIGLAALGAAVRGVDGRGPRTVLEDVVPAHYGMTGPLDVASAFHFGRLPRARLGELAPVVLACCDDDPVAAGIVLRLAGEVIAFAKAALSRLGLTESDPDVVLGGRLLRALSPSMVDVIGRGVQELTADARVLVARSEPIVGAALLGLDVIAADAAARERARAELDAAAATLVRSA